jgi:hypothetical protein
MRSRGQNHLTRQAAVKSDGQRFCRHLVQLQITAHCSPVGPGTAAPPSMTVNTTTRLARLRMGIAKAVARACSVVQFHAIAI